MAGIEISTSFSLFLRLWQFHEQARVERARSQLHRRTMDQNKELNMNFDIKACNSFRFD